MESRTVYLDVSTGLIHHRRSSDFSRFMVELGSVAPKAEILSSAVALRENENLSWRRIAELLGVKPTWLKVNLDAEGLVKRSMRREILITPSKTKEAISMREAKVPWKVIAKQLGVNAHSIRRAVYDGRHLQPS